MTKEKINFDMAATKVTQARCILEYVVNDYYENLRELQNMEVLDLVANLLRDAEMTINNVVDVKMAGVKNDY